MNKVAKLIIPLLILLLLIGCQSQLQKKPEQPAKTKEKPVQVDADMAEKAKSIAKSVAGVEEATAVTIDKNISVGIKVSGIRRIKLQTIKEEVHKKISQINNEYQVYVTSDKKLFKELQDMETQIKSQKIKTSSDLLPKLEKINEDMKG